MANWREGLSHRDQRFVEEYLVDLNATQAIMRVGPANQSCGSTYSTSASAANTGKKMLAKPAIAKAIETALHEVGVTRVWIIDKLASIANADLSKYMNVKNGRITVKDWESLDPELLPLIAECTQDYDKAGTPVGLKIRLKDDSPTVRYLAKLLRMEADRVELSGPQGGPVETYDMTAEILRESELTKKRLEDESK